MAAMWRTKAQTKGVRAYFSVSRFHAATILILVVLDGFRPSHAPANCSRRQPLSDEFFV
jgi:hypothetical protein